MAEDMEIILEKLHENLANLMKKMENTGGDSQKAGSPGSGYRKFTPEQAKENKGEQQGREWTLKEWQVWKLKMSDRN